MSEADVGTSPMRNTYADISVLTRSFSTQLVVISLHQENMWSPDTLRPVSGRHFRRVVCNHELFSVATINVPAVSCRRTTEHDLECRCGQDFVHAHELTETIVPAAASRLRLAIGTLTKTSQDHRLLRPLVIQWLSEPALRGVHPNSEDHMPSQCMSQRARAGSDGKMLLLTKGRGADPGDALACRNRASQSSRRKPMLPTTLLVRRFTEVDPTAAP